MYQWAAMKSYFSVPVKRTKPWNTWINFTELAETFMILSSLPTKEYVQKLVLMIERFVALMLCQ